jgi:hypothetical protein
VTAKKRTGLATAVLALALLTCEIARAGLVIVPTWDPSLAANLSPADVTNVQNAFNYAAQQFQNHFTDNFQLNVLVAAQAGTGIVGQSNAPLLGNFTYGQVRTALVNDQTAHPSADGATSIANLPLADPYGGANFLVARGLGKALQLIGSDATTDGTFTFGAGWSYTYDPLNRAVSGKFDFIGIAEHEISELMGRVARLNQTGNGNRPFDVFRYTGSGTPSTAFTDANVYFSINGGATNLKNFNANGNGGDLGDWASGSNDAFNAFSSTGVLNDLTPVDFRVMDVIGYNLVPEPGSCALLGIATCMLSIYAWRRRRPR